MDTSYLTTQVATIIGQLHGLFDEIGVPNHERESRESEVDTINIYTTVIMLILIQALYCSIRKPTQSTAPRYCVSFLLFP